MASSPVEKKDLQEEEPVPILTFKQKMGTTMVDLFVGAKQEHFHVHEEILCRKIPYFEKMFRGGFKEATTKTAYFPEGIPDLFDVLLGWIYDSTIRPLTLRDSEPRQAVCSWNILKFYILAEKLCLPELQDGIMDISIETWEKHLIIPDKSHIALVYAQTSPGSPARKFMARVFHWLSTRPHPPDNDNILPFPASDFKTLISEHEDLAVDFMDLLRKGTKSECPYKVKNTCEFHCHADDEPCYKD